MRLVFVVFVVSFFNALPAAATLVQVQFEADVFQVFGGITDVTAGDKITALFTYDDAAPTVPSSGGQAYDGNATGSFTIATATDSFTGSFGGFNPVVFNDATLGGFDQFDIRSFPGGVVESVSGDAINGIDFFTVFWIFRDNTGGIYSDKSLPTSLAQTDFDFIDILIYYGTALGQSGVRGTTTSLTSGPVTVPEPSTLGLLGAGLLGLFMRRKRVA